jgi:hypothetical protein
LEAASLFCAKEVKINPNNKIDIIVKRFSFVKVGKFFKPYNVTLNKLWCQLLLKSQ